jgi:hypothetical protein
VGSVATPSVEEPIEQFHPHGKLDDRAPSSPALVPVPSESNLAALCGDSEPIQDLVQQLVGRTRALKAQCSISLEPRNFIKAPIRFVGKQRSRHRVQYEPERVAVGR